MANESLSAAAAGAGHQPYRCRAGRPYPTHFGMAFKFRRLRAYFTKVGRGVAPTDQGYGTKASTDLKLALPCRGNDIGALFLVSADDDKRRGTGIGDI